MFNKWHGNAYHNIIWKTHACFKHLLISTHVKLEDSCMLKLALSLCQNPNEKYNCLFIFHFDKNQG
jgi:hypothetical protein